MPCLLKSPKNVQWFLLLDAFFSLTLLEHYFVWVKALSFSKELAQKQQSPHDTSPFSCFEYLISYKLVTNALSITYTKRSIWKGCLYTIICIFCCNSFYNHNGPVLYRWQQLLVKRNPLWLQLLFSSKGPAPIWWFRKNRLAGGCPSPHVSSSLIYGAPHVLFQSVTTGWEAFQPSPFFLANKYFWASLTWNKYQIVTINKCKHYTITISQEETDCFLN